MKKITLYTIAVLSIISCNLDKFPKDSLSSDGFFSTEAELQAFSNTFYTSLPSTSLYQDNADTYTQANLPDEISGLRIVPASGGNWTWTSIRRVNTLLDYSANCKDAKVRAHYDALARFFRAFLYFDKVKRFGDVPWYDTQLGSDSPELYKPRDSRELVMQKMIEDIDYAAANLGNEKNLYRITKWSALALKARFCLFEGTFRKYHGIEIEGGKTWDWYLDQAAKACETIMNEGGYRLYTDGGPSKCYVDLFASEDAIPCEVILARDYNGSLGIYHNSNAFTISSSNGQPGMTRRMVASYLMSNGSRFTDQPGWQTMEFAQECKNRDPRLAQTIRTPGYKRINGSGPYLPDFQATVTGYQLVKYVGAPTSDSYNKSFNDLIIFRLAEVYLNYAEAKAEMETLTQADLDASINKLRDRVGMPHLNLAAANSNPDPYLTSQDTGYPNVKGKNQGVILEIRRERAVELAQEGFRFFDIIRWKEGKAFNQPMHGMYFHGPGNYDLDGNGSIDLCLYEGTKPSTSATVSLKIGDAIKLSEGNKGYVMAHPAGSGKWDEDRDYYYPIPIDDRSLTHGALTQNPGWNDGLAF